jgi:hypothetical protein
MDGWKEERKEGRKLSRIVEVRYGQDDSIAPAQLSRIRRADRVVA